MEQSYNEFIKLQFINFPIQFGIWYIKFITLMKSWKPDEHYGLPKLSLSVSEGNFPRHVWYFADAVSIVASLFSVNLLNEGDGCCSSKND